MLYLRDTSLQNLVEGAVAVLVDELVELAGDDGVDDLAVVAVFGTLDVDEEVEGDLYGAMSNVTADPFQVVVAIPLFERFERDVLNQASVDDDLVAGCGAVMDLRLDSS